MFEELIQALDSQNLKPGNGRNRPGESIGLKKLCAAAGLSVPMWAERLRSVSIGIMIQEELQKAGYVVHEGKRGTRRTWSFSRLKLLHGKAYGGHWVCCGTNTGELPS